MYRLQRLTVAEHRSTSCHSSYVLCPYDTLCCACLSCRALGGFGVDIFSGAGSSSIVVLENVLRVKVVCFKPIDGVKVALASPLPAGYPANSVSIFTKEICVTVNGNRRCYNNDIHVQNHAMFVAPDSSDERIAAQGWQDDGFTLVQLNVTRLCEEYYNDQVSLMPTMQLPSSQPTAPKLRTSSCRQRLLQ
jgi:hypothetical protein